jgi:hypothetical protein
MTDIPITTELLRLSRDIKQAGVTLERREARYLVDSYYQMQDYRISSENQIRSMSKDDEPHLTLDFFSSQMRMLENQIKSVLDTWSSSKELGVWAKSITGIGPVIAAGLLAHIDIEKAPTVGHIWRYAGLDPTMTWEKGQKRPWNSDLKVICWKAGESFVKVSGNKNDIYGKFYVQRKEYEIERNDAVIEVDTKIVKGAMTDPNKGAYIVRDDEMVSAYLIEGKWYVGGNAQPQEDRQGHRRLQGLQRRQAASGAHPRPRQALRREAVPGSLPRDGLPLALRRGAACALPDRGAGARTPHPGPSLGPVDCSVRRPRPSVFNKSYEDLVEGTIDMTLGGTGGAPSLTTI